MIETKDEHKGRCSLFGVEKNYNWIKSNRLTSHTKPYLQENQVLPMSDTDDLEMLRNGMSCENSYKLTKRKRGFVTEIRMKNLKKLQDIGRIYSL